MLCWRISSTVLSGALVLWGLRGGLQPPCREEASGNTDNPVPPPQELKEAYPGLWGQLPCTAVPSTALGVQPVAGEGTKAGQLSTALISFSHKVHLHSGTASFLLGQPSPTPKPPRGPGQLFWSYDHVLLPSKHAWLSHDLYSLLIPVHCSLGAALTAVPFCGPCAESPCCVAWNQHPTGTA